MKHALDDSARRNAIQVLYAISTSIGTSLDLQQMLREVLSTILRSLSCAVGGVVGVDGRPRDDLLQHTMPRHADKNAAYARALGQLRACQDPADYMQLVNRMPAVVADEGSEFAHMLELPGYGVLILVRSRAPLDSYILRSMRPLLRRIANACRACLEADARKESETRLELALNAASLGLWNWDIAKQEAVLQDHPSTNLGYSEAIVDHPRTLRRLIHADDWPGVRARLLGHLRARRFDFEAEFRMKSKLGTWVWVMSRGQIVERDAEGRPVRMTGTIHDISARKSVEVELTRAKEAAEAAAKAKARFLATMSHEIRTPLTAIVGYAQLLNRPGIGKERFAEWQRDLLHNAEHLMGLISDVLDLSKSEEGKVRVRREPCNVVEMVQAAAFGMRPAAEEKQLALDVVFDGPIPQHVQTDQVRVRQVLLNLINNAIRYTDEGSVRVVVRLADPDGAPNPTLRIAIEDTGCGIPATQLESIFDPFTQLQTNTEVLNGTGLGLAISRRLARLLGGNLDVASTEGAGSTFTLSLDVDATEPCTVVAPTQPTPASEPMPRDGECVAHLRSQRELAGKRILLVEDGASNREILCFLLQEAGAEVDIAEDGAAGVAKALKHAAGATPYELILMDMQMPIMTGFEATRFLRGKGLTTPIVALTAYAMDGDRERCIEAGCAGYLTKPIVPATFFATLRKLLEPELSDPVGDAPSARGQLPNVQDAGPQQEPAPTSAPNPQMPSLRGLEALVARYRESLRDNIPELQRLLAAGDLAAIRTISHQLRGTGTNFGFPAVTECAGACEDAIRGEASDQDIAAAVARLVDALKLATKRSA